MGGGGEPRAEFEGGTTFWDVFWSAVEVLGGGGKRERGGGPGRSTEH